MRMYPLEGGETMKKFAFFVGLGFLLATACVVYVPTYDEEPPPDRGEYYERGYPSSLDTSYFYDYLSGYGSWIYYSPHNYVWVPRVTMYGWRPYTNGRWVYTNFGWTWVSQFEWGWAPFHYGRWGWDGDIGWFWVPGTVWGPAWVTWGRSNLYLGWAPLPPEARFIVGVGVTSIPYTLPPSFWVFVEGRYFMNDYIYRYSLPYERTVTIINYTTLQTNIIVQNQRVTNRGFGVEYISRVTKRRVTPYELRAVNRPQTSKVRMNNLEVYQPTINRNESAKPKTVIKKTEAKQKIMIQKEEISPADQEKRIQDRQIREEKLLVDTQNKEITDMKKKQEEAKKKAKTTEEKAKVEKEYNKKITEIKKKHDSEKTNIKERHKKDKEKAKKTKSKKVKKK